jgi:hypothetical protein
MKRNISQRARDLAEAFEVLTHEAQGQLGPAIQMAFFIGDGLQRAATDTLFDVLKPQTWGPSHLLRAATGFASQSARLSRLLAPGEAHLAWQELKNKVEVFALVKNLASILELQKDKFIPLPELVGKAYELSPYSALWAVEGVGHYYAEEYWERYGQPHGLLGESNAPVPSKSLLMLHAGMGLYFADRLIGELTTESDPQKVRAALEQFVALCRENSRPGYSGAAIESLGIVTRDFYPDLFTIVNQQFRVAAPEYVDFFWHGIGRAIYFSRKFFLPLLFSMWNDVNVEASTEHERLAAIAGLAWAFTLVNMRQPAIVESAVQSYATETPLADAFANGVCSCVIMRSDTTPGEPFVSEFYEHRPSPQNCELATAWERRIFAPAHAGIETYYPVLQQHHALDQIFFYHDLAKFTAELKNPGGTPAGRSAAGCDCCTSPEHNIR